MMNDGHDWIVDIDLAKFFDTVDHDKLMTLFGRTIKDGHVISIVGKFLVSGIMIGDEYEDSVIGTPQGGNISPLPANIMLNELDRELEARKLDFVRYADDCIIMVGSRQAAERVMKYARWCERSKFSPVRRKFLLLDFLFAPSGPKYCIILKRWTMEMKILAAPGCRILYRENASACVTVFESGERDNAEHLFGLVSELCPGRDFSLCIVPVDDWDRELSPWREECCGSVFEGEGEITLARMEKNILPFIESVLPGREIYTAGYSLAGLFALYALYRIPSLKGAASCSGSLWFPEWFERTPQMKLPEGSKVYLSLGGKEEKTSDPVMATVGKAYQRQFEMLKKAGIACTYEKNPGGHFKEPDLRLAKGIAWLIRQ